MFSASAPRLLRITDLRARNYRHVVLFLLLHLLAAPLLLILLHLLLPLLLLLLLLRPFLTDSNAADIRPSSRPFYVNHVVKDPTPPPGLEEALHVLRSSSKGRRRGTTLKRATALIAEEIRVPPFDGGMCTLNIDFFFYSFFLRSQPLCFIRPRPSPSALSGPFDGIDIAVGA